MVAHLQCAGLPHSEIAGSRPVCSSPTLIAAYHVLHRLQKPRHPPFALVTFSLNEFSLNHKPSVCTLDLTFTRCLEIAVHNITIDSLSFFLLQTNVISSSLLPRYLFSNLSMNFHLMSGVNHRCFSNGLQRYGLLFILQIFLQYFLQFFHSFFKPFLQLIDNQPIPKNEFSDIF